MILKPQMRAYKASWNHNKLPTLKNDIRDLLGPCLTHFVKSHTTPYHLIRLVVKLIKETTPK